MSDDLERLKHQLVAEFEANREKLVRWLQKSFPQLKCEAEDILHDAWKKSTERFEKNGFPPPEGWIPSIRWCARCRAIDRLRSWEFEIFGALARGDQRNPDGSTGQGDELLQVQEDRPDPAECVEERERRGRQGLLLSEVLQEFVRWCEDNPTRCLIKEAYERALRDEKPADIARAMGVPREDVYSFLHRARRWVEDRIKRKDVNRSVFITVMQRKGMPGNGPGDS